MSSDKIIDGLTDHQVSLIATVFLLVVNVGIAVLVVWLAEWSVAEEEEEKEGLSDGLSCNSSSSVGSGSSITKSRSLMSLQVLLAWSMRYVEAEVGGLPNKGSSGQLIFPGYLTINLLAPIHSLLTCLTG